MEVVFCSCLIEKHTILNTIFTCLFCRNDWKTANAMFSLLPESHEEGNRHTKDSNNDFVTSATSRPSTYRYSQVSFSDTVCHGCPLFWYCVKLEYTVFVVGCARGKYFDEVV